MFTLEIDHDHTQPELVKEWSALNESIKPTEIRENARELVWWTCRTCNHTWKASIATRVQGGGCPNCRQKVQAKRAVVKYRFSKDMARLENNMEVEALRYYLHTAQIEAEFGNKDVIGVPIDIYIPSVHGAIFSRKTTIAIIMVIEWNGQKMNCAGKIISGWFVS